MIAFRVDANEFIATGHVMRCLAIAVEIRKQGKDCIFFLAEQKGTELIEEKGFAYVVLQSKWDQLETEIPIMIEKMQEYDLEWLIVDSYQVTIEYLRKLNEIVPVLYLDDMAKEVYPVSMVLHYTDWLENDDYKKQYINTKTKVLAGMRYVPLREEFYPKKKETLGTTVLITTGGTDPYHITERFLRTILGTQTDVSKRKKLQKRKLQKIKYHIIVGAMNQDREKLKELEKQHSNLILHFNVNTMGELMRSSDFAISAGGTTLFELCACQIPTVCFSFAENQEAFAKKMGNHHVMLYAGDIRYQDIDMIENLCNGLEMLIDNNSYAEELKHHMGLLVDEKGTQRIVKELFVSAARQQKGEKT